VVAARWTVNDAATRVPFMRFHAELRAGRSVAEALQAAQAYVRTHEAWRHPFYWGAWEASGLAHDRAKPSARTGDWLQEALQPQKLEATALARAVELALAGRSERGILVTDEQAEQTLANIGAFLESLADNTPGFVQQMAPEDRARVKQQLGVLVGQAEGAGSLADLLAVGGEAMTLLEETPVLKDNVLPDAYNVAAEQQSRAIGIAEQREAHEQSIKAEALARAKVALANHLGAARQALDAMLPQRDALTTPHGG
jgi:hypothetical protein